MARTKVVSEKIESKNKARVLEAFDTLFNKRDYAAAERFWSPRYIQHSAHIAPGREGKLHDPLLASLEARRAERTKNLEKILEEMAEKEVNKLKTIMTCDREPLGT